MQSAKFSRSAMSPHMVSGFWLFVFLFKKCFHSSNYVWSGPTSDAFAVMSKNVFCVFHMWKLSLQFFRVGLLESSIKCNCIYALNVTSRYTFLKDPNFFLSRLKKKASN